MIRAPFPSCVILKSRAEVTSSEREFQTGRRKSRSVSAKFAGLPLKREGTQVQHRGGSWRFRRSALPHSGFTRFRSITSAQNGPPLSLSLFRTRSLTDYSQSIVARREDPSAEVFLRNVLSRVTLVGKDEPGPRGSRAVQGRQGRGTVGTAEHEGRTHRRPAAAGAVPVKLKIAEIAAVHPAVALVGLALLLQHHAPPFCPRVLEPDLRTEQAESVGYARVIECN